ncbi:MAG: MogA/MoaB family molybdenum cofactor biosynthesis protein [Acidimicrobiales bacterium]
MRAKVVTVSDGVIAGSRNDLSGRVLQDLLEERGFEVVERLAIADGRELVAETLRRICRDFHGLVVTTGGTGFSERDQTPEGTRDVLERLAPGFSELIRASSPLGALSRGVAGTVGRSLVINVPGSPKAARESIEAVFDLVGHALALMIDGRAAHPDSSGGASPTG